LGRYTNFNDGDSQSFTIDNNALAEWQSDSFEHRFLTGFDLQHHENSWLGNSAIGSSAGNVNILNPTYVTPDISADLYDNEITKQQLGLYAQYQTKWDQKWIFNLGGRYDSVNLESTATNKDEMDDGQLSLSGGLMYLSDNGFSPYVSYSESFYAVSSIDATTKKLFKPIESAQREVGVKYMPTWLDGYFNVAWFDIEQGNATVSALVDGVLTTSQKGSQQNTKGVEVEAKIAMTENLIVNANYTYLDSHSGEGSERSRDSLIPRHLASGWVTYDFSGLGIEGLTVGSGVRYTGTSVDSPKNETIPAYRLWDAMATYVINKQWDMQFNVSNLTNEEYVAGCDWGTCYYGESRRMTATVNYNWDSF
jgi:iron complex outermembrane receptor protein